MTGRAVASSPVVGPSPTLLADVLAVLADAADGLPDAGVRAALADRHPGLKTQKVNLLCRRLCAAGDLERVGTRPIRNRLRRARDEPSGPLAHPVPPGDPGSAPPGPAETVATPTVVVDPPVHDPELAWSRGVNVAASVAVWLTRRGAAVRAATGTAGPDAPHSHDLVVRLDGQDVHVEVTGWPPADTRRHCADTASEWFAAAAGAALVRERAHPGARVVIALPETRRYRTLVVRAVEQERSGPAPVTVPEVWFVDGRGAVRPLARFTPAVGG